MFGKSVKLSSLRSDRRLGALLKTVAVSCGRLSVLGVALLVFAISLNYRAFPPRVAEGFPVQEIRFQGLVHLDKESLEGMLRESISTNLLLVDLDRLRQLVESESWVKKATVRRKVPDQLVIQVTEREPSAMAEIDSELFLVDAQGVVLDRPAPHHRFVDRPVVKGLQNVARENARQENALRMQLYLRVLEELAPYNQSISEIDVGSPDQVAVTPEDDPILIYLGDRRFVSRYETFVAQKELYQRLKKEYGAIESVDVTFDDKIIFHTPGEPVAAPNVKPS